MIQVPPLDGTAISVGSLRRREGRAPHSVDRLVRPRAHHYQQAAEADAGSRILGVVVRRAAVAAGTLLAAGSVFGTAVLTEPSAGSDAPEALDGASPGPGVRAGEPAAAGVLPGPWPTASSLDDGVAAPMSWLPVAFPATLDAGTAADPPMAGSPGVGRVGTIRAPNGTAPGTDAPANGTPGAGAPDSPAGPSGATPSGPPPSTGPPTRSGPVTTVVDSVAEPVGDLTEEDVGEVAPEPLKAPVRSPDTAVAPVEPVFEVAEPVRNPTGLVHTVGRTAASLLGG